MENLVESSDQSTDDGIRTICQYQRHSNYSDLSFMQQSTLSSKHKSLEVLVDLFPINTSHLNIKDNDSIIQENFEIRCCRCITF